MRALWGKAPFQFDLRQVPTPTPGVGEVLVRISACGICGTDLHFLRAMNTEWTPLGHELCGRVEQVGEGASRLRIADSVIVENNTGCGVCDACKNGESRYCRNIFSFMNDQAGLGEYICVPETSLQKYSNLTSRQACLAEPLTVAIDVTLRADIPLNGEVAVLGRWRHWDYGMPNCETPRSTARVPGRIATRTTPETASASNLGENMARM